MTRKSKVQRNTTETRIDLQLTIDGKGHCAIDTGIGFFDHMLTLFSRYSFFDLELSAKGDLEVDWHHTVEDVGLVLGDAISQALGSREGIQRYGHGVTPMDESLSMVTVDLSNRPFLVYQVPADIMPQGPFDVLLAKEFFRALATRAGMNLHITVPYGENQHHIIESIFKGLGRALDQATRHDPRIQGVHSTKGQI
ncbi:MAG: imidazoleglycerol-phosphate dehydratase HisB [Desulfobacterales bacterium]